MSVEAEIKMPLFFRFIYFCTWTLDSGRLIFSATSSRMNMSGYRVLANRASRTSSWERVKVVRSRRCFLGVAAGKKGDTEGRERPENRVSNTEETCK